MAQVRPGTAIDSRLDAAVPRQHDLRPVENVKEFWLLSAGVDAIGSLISRAWIAGSARIGWVAAGSGHQDRGECARGDSPNAKRYVRERRSQPTDRRESTLSGTARAFGVGDSTLRAWLEPIRRGASLDPLSAVEVISMVAGRLPPSSAHPTRPKVLVSPSLISNRLSRTPPRGHVVCVPE